LSVGLLYIVFKIFHYVTKIVVLLGWYHFSQNFLYLHLGCLWTRFAQPRLEYDLSKCQTQFIIISFLNFETNITALTLMLTKKKLLMITL